MKYDTKVNKRDIFFIENLVFTIPVSLTASLKGKVESSIAPKIEHLFHRYKNTVLEPQVKALISECALHTH